ncbi:alpha/beta hydrolase [Halobacillus seohaensis]|uniref:Alpha/beta hydrolase n=1 Tax=Halobacillus seohaensis TaxID=447421 RepID=A0ABW2EN50_9BACI
MFNTMLNDQKKFMVLTILSFLLGSSLFFVNSTPTRSEKPTELIPTVFVHGFKGGPASFNTMLDRFESNNWGTKRMIIYVSDSGDIRTRGNIPHTMNPFIQVIFENNRASIANQTNWIKKIMRKLNQDYAISKLNLVGHSMGGLATTNFLLNNQDGNYPDVEKLVAIGTPFLGISLNDYFSMNTGAATIDLQVNSNALVTMLNSKENFDQYVHSLSIAGVINNNAKEIDEWDGLVTKPSAHGLKNIVPQKNYYKKTLSDPLATHSGLHEHKDVDQAVAKFLWNLH